MSEQSTAGRYHDAAYTLDENVKLPEDPEEMPLSAGHDEPDAEAVREKIEAHKEQAKEEAQAQAERDREFAERDPKPKPSELLAESGREPAPADDSEPEPAAGGARDGSEVPDGTTQDVLDWVGDDQARAQQALDAENARSTPRTTLVAELEKRA